MVSGRGIARLLWSTAVLLMIPVAGRAEQHGAEAVRPSIGTCHQPDFFFLNVEADPIEIRPGEIPRCRFSVMRYLPDEAYHPSSLDELATSLEPGVPVCLLIHGAFVSYESAVRDYPALYRQVVHAGGHRPVHFIAVHWPAEFNLLPCPCVKLNQLERRADAIGMCVARFLAMLPAENPVCLLGHSLGTRITAQALQALAYQMVPDPISAATGCRRRIRAVFTAATIDHHWLNPGERFDGAIGRVECMLNFTNLLDPALKAYPLNDPLLHHPLGQNGLICFDRWKLGDQAEKVRQRDVSVAVHCGHFVESYYAQPSVINRLIPYVYFD